jgi:hypothetical protein
MVEDKLIKYGRTDMSSTSRLFEIRDLLEKIMTYADEDDRFQMRSLNRMFHSFFYGQTVMYNFRRVLHLSKNRQFPRLDNLQINLDCVPGSTLRYVTTSKFPRLTSISLNSTEQRVTSGDIEILKHPGIQELKVDLSQPADITAIKENNLPGLSKLSISIKGFISVMQPNRPFRLNPHTKLREVTVDHQFLDGCFFETLTPEYFPQLSLLTLGEDACFFTELDNEDLEKMFNNNGIKLEFVEKADNTGGMSGMMSLDRNIINLL